MSILLNPDEVEFTAISAEGTGGQNVNKVSCAVHLRFDIKRSSLPDDIKQAAQQAQLAIHRRKHLDSMNTHGAQESLRGRMLV